MKYSHVLVSLGILTLAVFAAGCASKPTEMIEQTELARQQAQAEHAEQFALNDWNEAEKAWDQAAQKLEAESYGEAYTLLLKAKTRYNKAKELAAGQRAQAIKDIEGLQNTAKVRCDKLKESIAAKRLSSSKKKEMEEEVTQIEQQIAQISDQVEKGQYNDAKFLASKTLRRIWEAEQTLK